MKNLKSKITQQSSIEIKRLPSNPNVMLGPTNQDSSDIGSLNSRRSMKRYSNNQSNNSSVQENTGRSRRSKQSTTNIDMDEVKKSLLPENFNLKINSQLRGQLQDASSFMQNKGVNKSQVNATLDMNGPPEGHSYVKYNTEASQESSFLVSI